MVRFVNLDREFGFPQGTLDSLWAQESSRGQNRGSSSAGARGHFQFMQAAASEMRSMGLDPFSDNPDVAARAAATYLQRQVRAFDGDMAKGLAAYNAGGGNVRSAVRNGGGNWLARLPAETRNYVPSVLGRLGTSAGEIDGIEEYSRNYDAGRRNPEEDRRQAARNRELLEEGGVDTNNMTMDALLGKMFMALFGSIVERMVTQERATAPQASTATPPVQDVPNGTDVTPNAPAAPATRTAQRSPTPA